jgi:hypothetical protein
MKQGFILIILSLLLVSCERSEREAPVNKVKRDFHSFIFTGMSNRKPALYKYNVKKNSFSLFWKGDSEEIVDLSYSPDHNSAFFLTASRQGKQGIFPFVKNARLYVIPDSASHPEFVRDIGSGIQIFSRWESETVFRIILNSWDKKVSTYIDQKTIILNIFGRILQEEKQVYDITSDGYPRLPRTKPDSLSPSGKYQVKFNENDPDSVFLIQRNTNNAAFMMTINKPVNEIIWSDNRDVLFVSTLDVTPANTSIFSGNPNTSSLYVYSIDQQKLIKKWTGGGYKNFFTIGDFLIFDDGFERNSSIYIYNFKEDKVIKRIKIKGGCGLRGIPETPRFGA